MCVFSGWVGVCSRGYGVASCACVCIALIPCTKTTYKQQHTPHPPSPHLAPMVRMIRRNSAPYAAASLALRISGSLTISNSGTPALLKSTNPYALPLNESAPPYTSFPASSSRCARVMPMRCTLPSGRVTSMWPCCARGRSYWEI